MTVRSEGANTYCTAFLLSLPYNFQVRSVQSLSHVQLFATPWYAAHQASLSIKLVMSSNHLILCHPLLLLSSIFPNIRGFSNESVLGIRWPKYFLPRSKLQSPSAVILEPPKIKSVTVSIVSPSICHEKMGQDARILVS